MSFGRIIQAPCVNMPAPPDTRCQDIAFALANPDLCPPVARLILEPGVALVCAFGSIQFHATFISADGLVTDVTVDSMFFSSNPDVALVGAISGNATGLAAGEATISAKYKGLTALASLTVLAAANCCDDTHVGMMVVVDNSRSMSLVFSGAYTTRLAFAKAAATRFINEVNVAKDTVGLISFNASDQTLLSPLSSGNASIAALVPGIAQTQQKTTFFEALSLAIAQLSTATEQVIVLISDGEDTTQNYSGTNNPLTLISNFKAAGGIVICLGCRASGKGFNFLSALSTGGFFINGYGLTEQASLDYLSGLKGYICAGNCTPEGDVIVHKGKLNYSGFINWDVLDGGVDLQGNGFFDFLPGNGLYVDLAGTDPSQRGRLQSKAAFNLTAGHDYRLAVDLSGNQRVDATPESARIRVYYFNGVNPVYLLDQLVSVNDYSLPFTNYAFTFTAPASVAAYVSIQQEDQPLGGDPTIGLMLNRVLFEDRTDLITLLDDNFDSENPVYVPPRCGIATLYQGIYGYAGGYNCYGTGCLTTPPAPQLPDPNALPDIESGYTPPNVFVSTQTVCAPCGVGLVNVSTVNLIPTMTGALTPSGEAASSSETVGTEAWRAFGGSGWHTNAALTGWLRYKFPVAPVVSQYELTALSNLTPIEYDAPYSWTFQGSNDAVSWTTLDTRTAKTFGPGQKLRYGFTNTTAYLYYRLNVTANNPDGTETFIGLLKLAMFATAPTCVPATATATSDISQQVADQAAAHAANIASQALLNCIPFYTSTEQYTAQCGPNCAGPDITRSASATSFNSQAEADADALAVAKAAAIAALICQSSNNTQPIVLTAGSLFTPAPGSPYPSVKYVTGVFGGITKVTVVLKNVTFGPDLSKLKILLRSPQGIAAQLMSNAWQGGAATGQNITFDDAGATTIPCTATGILATATWKPTTCPPGTSASFQPPAPTGPYPETLAAFNGQLPAGCWSLWVIDDSFSDSGQIAGGWDLTITAPPPGP